MKNGTASKLETGQLAELASAIIRQLPHVEGLGEVAQGWIENGAALKKVLWEALVPLTVYLEQASTVSLPAIGRFVARDHFTSNCKEITIAGIGDGFKKHFLSKIEKSQKEVELNISNLKKQAEDGTILALLKSRTETSLTSIWELLKRQPRGQIGKLSSNCVNSNVFYVPDINGHICTVKVIWNDYGWCINAFSFGREWGEGEQIFFSNS